MKSFPAFHCACGNHAFRSFKDEGLTILVSPEDIDLIRRSLAQSKSPGNHVYALQYIGGPLKRKYRFLHRVITGAVAGQVVDHINRDSLDNRRSNLRLCSQSENCANRIPLAKSQTGLKGAFRSGNRFESVIIKDGSRRYLGKFATAEEAHQAYRAAATEMFGEFARFN